VYAAGRFSTTATPTLLVGLYYGAVAGVAIAATSAITTASGVTNLTWEFECTFRVRTVGSAGTALGTGKLYGVPAATSVNLAPASAPAKALTIGAQWGTANASNTITCHHFDVDMAV
jgi:hypothetical protein